MSLDIPTGAALRSEILERSIYVEGELANILKKIIKVKEPKSLAFGSSNSALSLKQKVDLLYDLGWLYEQNHLSVLNPKDLFELFMVIRNKFVHLSTSNTFTDVIESLNDKFQRDYLHIDMMKVLREYERLDGLPPIAFFNDSELRGYMQTMAILEARKKNAKKKQHLREELPNPTYTMEEVYYFQWVGLVHAVYLAFRTLEGDLKKVLDKEAKIARSASIADITAGFLNAIHAGITEYERLKKASPEEQKYSKELLDSVYTKIYDVIPTPAEIASKKSQKADSEEE